MDRMEWNGKEYLDLIRMDPMSSQILSYVIENGVMAQALFLKGKNSIKVSHILKLFQEKGILESLESSAGNVIGLPAHCYLPSCRSALGETPGRRSHRYPELWLRDSALKDLRSLCCALARGRFLMEWRSGAWEEVVCYRAQESKIWIPEEGASYGALRISPLEKNRNELLWILFDPREERSEEEEKRRSEWVHGRSAGEAVMILQENVDGKWEKA